MDTETVICNSFIERVRRLNNEKEHFNEPQFVSEARYYTEHFDEWRDLKYLLAWKYFEHPGFDNALKRLEQIERLLPEQIRSEPVDYDDQKRKDCHLDDLIEELLDQKHFSSEEVIAWARYYLRNVQTLPTVQSVTGSLKQINVENIKKTLVILEQSLERSKWATGNFGNFLYGTQFRNCTTELTGRITVDLYPHPPPAPNRMIKPTGSFD